MSSLKSWIAWIEEDLKTQMPLNNNEIYAKQIDAIIENWITTFKIEDGLLIYQLKAYFYIQKGLKK